MSQLCSMLGKFHTEPVLPGSPESTIAMLPGSARLT
jgi:hypothetical protein